MPQTPPGRSAPPMDLSVGATDVRDRPLPVAGFFVVSPLTLDICLAATANGEVWRWRRLVVPQLGLAYLEIRQRG